MQRNNKNKDTKPKKSSFQDRKYCGYKIACKLKEEPPGGWAEPSITSHLGKHFICLYKSGLNAKTEPTAIYHKYPLLQDIEPGDRFRQFKNRCVQAYRSQCKINQEASWRKISPSSSASASTSASASSDQESIMMSSDSDDDSSQGVPAREGWTGNGRRKRDAPDREVRAEHQLVLD